MGLVAPRHVGSSQTRARTHVPCIGRQILNHCATREAQGLYFKHNPLVILQHLRATDLDFGLQKSDYILDYISLIHPALIYLKVRPTQRSWLHWEPKGNSSVPPLLPRFNGVFEHW